jgi:hypothetical protein
MDTRAWMKLRHNIFVSWAMVAAVSLCHTTSAAAQDESFKFEITPFTAYRIGGQFDEKDGDGQFELNESGAQGITLNINANPNGQYELLYARQDTEVDTQGLFATDPVMDLDVEYFQFGGTYLFDGENTLPFIALTLGVTHFDPQPAEFDSESYFSASFGGGVQLNATKRIGVRIEGRVFTTLIESDSDIFCSSAGGAGACLIQVDGTTLTQWEARVGLVFRF